MMCCVDELVKSYLRMITFFRAHSIVIYVIMSRMTDQTANSALINLA